MKRVTTISLVSCLWLVGACSSGSSSKKATGPASGGTESVVTTGDTDEASGTTTEAAKPALSKEEQEKQKRLERIAETKAKMEADQAKEAERWTDELHAAVQKLVDSKQKNVKKRLQEIVASQHRKPGNPDRDAHRHPVETLMFFGIKPNMTVVEAGPGGGWYTEILAPLLAKKGKLVVVAYDPDGPQDQMYFLYGLTVKAFMENAPEMYSTAEMVAIMPPDNITFGEDGSADMVLVTREMHGWYRSGNWDAYMQAAHDVLKPGGILAVVQHRAPKGADPEESVKSGYLPQEWVISAVESAGFKLEAKSEINANPKDTKDYPGGVWTLPPRLREGDKDKDKYEAIGESDRMTLKFKKKKK